MTIEIRSQRIAREAYRQVESARTRKTPPEREKYLAFARSFPTLIHACGIAQASAFALAKGDEKAEVLEAITNVVYAVDSSWNFTNASGLHNAAIHGETSILKYLRLTRQALDAATWIKRYAEALLKDSSPQPAADPSESSEDRDKVPPEISGGA